MLTSKKVVNAINKQIGNEFGASMQYVAIAAYGLARNPARAQGCGPHGAASRSFTSCVCTSGRNLTANPSMNAL